MSKEMTLAEIETASKLRPLVHQLFSLKRCFGPQATIGIVTGPGCATDYCGSIAELVEKGHISTGLEWLDPFLAKVSSITKRDSESPWETARREQEAARERRDANRIAMKMAEAVVVPSRWYTCH